MREYKFISINDSEVFEHRIQNVYSPKLKLGKENIDPCTGSFLDLDIKIKDRSFIFNQYDLKDAFPFAKVRLPFTCGNVLSKIYSSISAECLRNW